MTRLRPAFTWAAFAVCLGAVGAALVWVSRTTLRLEEAEFRNNEGARQAENERLALWRMESALVPLVAQESSRPYYMYRPFYSPEQCFSKWFQRVEKGEIKFPSDLLTVESPHVLIHFAVGPDGRLTSPQVPLSNERDVAEESYTTHEKIVAAEKLLKSLAPVLTRERLLRALSLQDVSPSAPIPVSNAAAPPGEPPPGLDSGAQQAQSPAPQQVAARNFAEFQKRQQASNQSINDYRRKGQEQRSDEKPMRAFWLDGRLVLARESRAEGRPVVQGCVLNWTGIRAWLTGEVNDLLPNCRLVPAVPAAETVPEYRLASLPIRMEPGDVVVAAMPVWTTTRLALALSWLCFLLAAGAVGFLLFGAMRLSERRGAFVSAVTHELRTPLTTFRMYTEMLNREMVTDESRRDYLETLHREADRLGHLVENVLSYARLENARKHPAREEFELDAVLEHMQQGLTRRAGEVEMTLVCETESETPVCVTADAAAVERIVFNLVDNACKYSRDAGDKRVHIACRANGTHAEVRIRDHGPGISPDVEKRLFRPFSKSDCEAANSAPGVGLGLSLSRRLARSMGGDLTLDRKTAEGACFVLSLPLARSTSGIGE